MSALRDEYQNMGNDEAAGALQPVIDGLLISAGESMLATYGVMPGETKGESVRMFTEVLTKEIAICLRLYPGWPDLTDEQIMQHIKTRHR